MADFVINTVENVTLVTINNVSNNSRALAAIFDAIKDINIDMICQTAPYKDSINLSFTIDEGDLTRMLTIVGGLQKTASHLATEISPGNCKITIFSELLKTESGVAAKVFDIIAKNDMQVRLITTSDVEISLLVDSVYAESMAKVLTEAFC